MLRIAHVGLRGRSYAKGAAASANVGGMLDAMASLHPHRCAVQTTEGNKRNFVVLEHFEQDQSAATYKELQKHVDAFAAGMQELGYSKGDTLVTVMGNSLEHVVTQLAAAKLGVVVVPFDKAASVEDIRAAVGSNVKGVVADVTRVDELEDLAASNVQLICTGSKDSEHSAMLFRRVPVYGAIVKNHLNKGVASLPGTSALLAGDKKLTHASALQEAKALADALKLTHTDRVIATQSVATSGGLLAVLAALSKGSAVLLQEAPFAAEAAAASIKRDQATALLADPAHVAAIKAVGGEGSVRGL